MRFSISVILSVSFSVLAGAVSIRDADVAVDASVGASTGTTLTSTTTVTVKNLVSKDGTGIYAEGQGNKLGPHVILAHGLACTGLAFDPLFSDPSLTSQLYMVRFDTRGHGRSGKPLDPSFYTTDRYADDLKAVIAGFGLNKPFYAGWSLAGAIAADIATNFPHPLPFSGLIWFSALPYIGDILPKVATPLVLSFLPGLEDVNNGTNALSTRIAFVETLSAHTNTVPFDTKTSWVGSSAYLPPAVASLVLGRSQDPTRLIAEAAAGWPALIIHGDADLQINGTAVISNMAPLFKNIETHLLPGVGHISFYDAEAQTAKIMLAWIAKVRSQHLYP